MSFWFGCWVVCVVVVLFFVFSGDTLIIVSPFLSYRGIANQTRCIDDRLSFERARHRQKKSPVLVIIMTVVPTRQPSQSIGGLTMQQVLASDQWLLYLWSPHLVAYYIEKDLHPILSDTSSYLFKHFSFHRKDECMHGPKPTVTNRASRCLRNRSE